MSDTLYDPDSGWFLKTNGDGGFARCFRNGRSLSLDENVVRELMKRNRGNSTSGFLERLVRLEPPGLSELYDLTGDSKFTPDPDLRDVLSLGEPHRLWIEVQGECNEQCLHCYAESAPTNLPQLSLPTVRDILDDARTAGFRRVQFTGGDPLLWPDLPEVVHRCAEQSMQPEIFTNGLELSETLYSNLKDANPEFSFSFYSHEADTHDKITGRPGSWESTLEAIERALKGPTSLRVAIVIMEQNRNDLEETRKFLEQRGVPPENIGWNVVQEVGRGERYPKDDEHWQPPPDEQNTDHGGRENRSFNPGKLCVTYDGQVVPCIFQRWISLGNLDDRSLGEVLRNPTPRMIQDNLPDDTFGRDAYSCAECQFQHVFLRHFMDEVAHNR